MAEKWWTLVLSSGNASLALSCPRMWRRDYTKRNTKTNTVAVRGCETYKVTHMPLKNQIWVYILHRKTNEPPNMSRNIYNRCLFVFSVSLIFECCKIQNICPNCMSKHVWFSHQTLTHKAFHLAWRSLWHHDHRNWGLQTTACCLQVQQVLMNEWTKFYI